MQIDAAKPIPTQATVDAVFVAHCSKPSPALPIAPHPAQRFKPTPQAHAASSTIPRSSCIHAWPILLWADADGSHKAWSKAPTCNIIIIIITPCHSSLKLPPCNHQTQWAASNSDQALLINSSFSIGISMESGPSWLVGHEEAVKTGNQWALQVGQVCGWHALAVHLTSPQWLDWQCSGRGVAGRFCQRRRHVRSLCMSGPCAPPCTQASWQAGRQAACLPGNQAVLGGQASGSCWLSLTLKTLDPQIAPRGLAATNL